MQAYGMVREYYLKYGMDTAGCAADFLGSVREKTPSERKIKKIAVYYPVMNRGGVQRVISLLLPIYYSIHYEVILITEKISDEDYDIPGWVKRFVITGEGQALTDRESFSQRYEELEDILEAEAVDLFFHHGVRQTLFVYDIMLAKTAGIYTAAEKHQVFTQGFCDVNDLFWVHLSAFQIVDGLVVLSTLEETYWRTFGINAFYIENPLNRELETADTSGKKDSVAWIGRLDVYSKQYFDVLEIAAIVKKAHPEVKFRMYGSGTGAKIRELAERIGQYGLEDSVHFCGYETDIGRMYRNTRIQLVTSAYEGFPMVVYESKIMGIPLVMYDLPYLELLKNGLGYISVPNGDIQGIAESICKILDNPELETRLRDEAGLSIQDFNNEKVGQKWSRFFHDIEKHMFDNSGKNDEYSVILRTMHRHYAVAQKKFEKLLWDSEQSVLVFHVRRIMREGQKLVICPFGKAGKRVKEMLNEKGIWETYIVDNGMAQKHSDILSMENLKRMDCANFFFIICCEDEDLKRWFRSQLTGITGADNIMYYDKALE